MKISFVGSSHGVPEPNRKCSCIMLEVGENVYFIDMGTSAIDYLRTRGISIDRVKGIFVTHMHGDHTNGLVQFIDLITWYFKTPDPVVCLPDIKAAKVIDDWLKVTLNTIEKKINYRETKSGVVYDDGVLKATAIPTKHCPNSHAYLIEAEGKRLLFTGDLNRPGNDFPNVGITDEIDLIVCESAHFPATEYLPVFENRNIKKVVVTHYVNKYYENVYALTQALAEKGIESQIATDQLEISL